MVKKNTKHIPDSDKAGKKGKNNDIYDKSGGGKDHNSYSDLQTSTQAGSTDNNRFVSHNKNMKTTGDSAAMGSAKAFSFEEFTKNKLGDPSSATMGKKTNESESINESKNSKADIISELNSTLKKLENSKVSEEAVKSFRKTKKLVEKHMNKDDEDDEEEDEEEDEDK
jgi:hypothetical protein